MTDLRASLAAATRLYDKTGADHEAARQAVVDAVLAALRGGITPTEVEQLSPFSSTHIRKLARDNEIPPATRGPKPRADRQRSGRQ